MGNKENAYKLKYLPDTATSGKYLKGQPDGTAVFTEVTVAWEDISGKPTIEEVGATTWDSIPDKPATFPPSTHNHDELYEPKITTKRTAFNKDFGTGNGDVARGDHTHDYSELTGTPPSGGGDGYTKAEADAKFALKTNPPANFGFIYAPGTVDLNESSETGYSKLRLAYADAGVTASVDGSGNYVVSGAGGYTVATTEYTNDAYAIREWTFEISLPSVDITLPDSLNTRILFGVITENGSTESSNPNNYQQQVFMALVKTDDSDNSWGILGDSGMYSLNGVLNNTTSASDMSVQLQANKFYRFEMSYPNAQTYNTLRVFDATTGALLFTKDYTNNGINVLNKRTVILSRDGSIASKPVKSAPITIRRWIEVTPT